MDIRERTELWEKEKLSQYAMLACNSKGRKNRMMFALCVPVTNVTVTE